MQNVIPFPTPTTILPPPSLSLLQRDVRSERAATNTNRTAQEIEQLPFDLSALEDEGVFINVDATGFGLLDRRLDWQALGIALPQNTDVNFTPPRCGLLPNRYRRPLLTPVSRAHAALHKYSYQFRLTETVFETPAYRWVPWRAFSAFEAAFQTAEASLNAARNEVLAHYDEIRAEVVATFRRLATDSAQRLFATGRVVPTDFVERVVSSVLSAFPTREELQHKLQLRYQVGVILLGSEMLREQRCAAEERRDIEQARADTRAARLQVQVLEQTAQQQLWAEQERIRLQLTAAEQEQQREAEVKARLRQLKVDAAREKLQETLSPLQEGAEQLRAQIYESAQAMHEALQKHDFLPGATAKKARQLTEWFRLMNFQSDAELDELLSRLAELTAKPTRAKRRPSNDTVQATLNDIMQLCYRDANALSQPNRLAALEL